MPAEILLGTNGLTATELIAIARENAKIRISVPTQRMKRVSRNKPRMLIRNIPQNLFGIVRSVS